MTTTTHDLHKRSTAAALKAERDRDKLQAAREYAATTLAVEANTARLRELRLAKLAADAQAARTQPAVKRTAAGGARPRTSSRA